MNYRHITKHDHRDSVTDCYEWDIMSRTWSNRMSQLYKEGITDSWTESVFHNDEFFWFISLTHLHFSARIFIFFLFPALPAPSLLKYKWKWHF